MSKKIFPDTEMVNTSIADHNGATDAHPDIRGLISSQGQQIDNLLISPNFTGTPKIQDKEIVTTDIAVLVDNVDKTTLAEIDALIKPGEYRFSCPDMPFQYGALSVTGSDFYIVQTITNMAGVNMMYRRTPDAGVNWSEWRDISPIESGSNANGNWTRFSDGTQICYFTGAALNDDVGLTVGDEYAYSWTYPASFQAKPILTAGVYFVSNQYDGGAILVANSISVTVGRVQYKPSKTNRVHLGLTAIGRWR